MQYWNTEMFLWKLQRCKNIMPCNFSAFEGSIVNLQFDLHAVMSTGKWPPDHSHVQSTTGWFVSDLWPSLPLLFPLHQGLSAKTKWRRRGEKKELLLKKLHTAETRTSYLNCWLVLQGYWVHIRPFSQICSHFGPWKDNHEISCFAA